MKKMRKANVITALALAMVMLVAMTGIAVAESIGIVPVIQPLQPDQSPPDGGYSTYTVSVTGISYAAGGNDHTIKAVTTAVAGGGSLDDLRFNFTHGTSNSGWINSSDTWAWNDGGYTPASLILDVMDTSSVGVGDVTYQFKVYDSYNLPSFSISDTASGTAYGTGSIPEFATIAIPVASILGLLFFFNHRKHKKE